MLKPIFIAFISAVFLCGCADKNVPSEKEFARFYARSRLIQKQYEHSPDTLQRLLVGLYSESGLTPEGVAVFQKKMEKNPERWEDVQRLVLEELKNLDSKRK